MRTNPNPKRLLAVAFTVSSAFALVAGSTPAHAAPCARWGVHVGGDETGTRIEQSNGWGLEIAEPGPERTRPNGRAASFKTESPLRTEGWGHIEGTINEQGIVNLFVRWDSGVAGSLSGRVAVDGTARGETSVPGVTWWTVGPLDCVVSGEFRTDFPPAQPRPTGRLALT
jgi:hypothetical protein